MLDPCRQTDPNRGGLSPMAPPGGEFVGQRNLSVTADVYSHVLGDETELDYASLLA